MFNTDSKIYVAGHSGLLGSALIRVLKSKGYENLITRTHDELELTHQEAVENFFQQEKPEYVFLAAAKVGGIVGNKTYPANYLHTNIAIQDNVFESANRVNVQNVVYYGSSCTYPKLCEQPMKEEYWLSGKIEMTSQAYAAAKISGIIGCQSYNIQYNTNRFIALLPNSMYGPNDNFDLENSHVLSALLRKIHVASRNGDESLTLWGSGTPKREFIFSEDVAEASVFAIQNAKNLENNHYNIGTGYDISIKELATKIASLVGFKGEIKWDTSIPDGTPKKLLDSSRFLELGWKPSKSFDDGLKETYDWMKKNCKDL